MKKQNDELRIFFEEYFPSQCNNVSSATDFFKTFHET